MTTANTSGDSAANRRVEADLGRRYGRIAISALVAALPYRSETKNDAYAPSKPRQDRAA
jgi:hypothetical protein